MRNKISESHVKIYEYFVRLVNRTKNPTVITKYFDIVVATGYTYPIIAKVLPDLIRLKCLELISHKKGRGSVGSTYLVDTGFKVVRERIPMTKVYKVKKRNKKKSPAGEIKQYIYRGKWTREEIRFSRT